MDMLILLPLLYGAYRGFMNGFVHEIIYLIFLILCIFFGYRLVEFVSEQIETTYNYHSDFLKVYSFIGVLIVSMILIHFLTKGIESLLKIVGLGLLNKLAGALFGIVKWALIVSLVLNIITAFDKDQEIISKEKRNKSMFYHPAMDIAQLLIPSMEVATFDITKKVNEAAKKIKKY
jgi:membrane protein required for colicin V production